MSKYLDIEKLECTDKVIELDDDIIDTIIILNKKGYNTIASCSGHSDIEFYPYYAPLEEKEKILNAGHIILDEADTIYAAFPSISTYCYVKFDKTYNFESLPDKFEYASDNETLSDTISRRIDFFNSEGKRKSKDIIDNEIKEVNKVLLEWSKKLENIKEDNIFSKL